MSRGRMALFWFLAVFVVGVAHRCLSTDHSLDAALRSVRASSPKRDEEFTTRLVPKNRVPLPLPGCEDAIGGIESITIDDKRYWFGFSYSSDAVLSPLIDDARTMAQFGSDYMLQTDGAHPPDYWERMALAAVDTSDLDSEPGGRDFTGSEVSEALREVEAARDEHRAAKLWFSYNLAYLLHATHTLVQPEGPQPCNSPQGKAIRRIDRYEDCLSAALLIAAKTAEPPPNTTYDDALLIIGDYMRAAQRDVPENWQSLLVSPQK